jgi:iron complex outermembrane receptor protein
VNTNFINSTAIDTSGFDFNARGTYETNIGIFAPSFSATYVTSYDITTANGTVIDGTGALNRSNVGNPTPELRANLGLNWISGAHSANIFYRYVDSYERNETANTDSIDSFGQVDIQYSVLLGSFLREDSATSLTVGLINAFDEDPPFVAIAGSYDPRTGDPRGRRAYVKLGLSF